VEGCWIFPPPAATSAAGMSHQFLRGLNGDTK
jgi:hypothetical protein